MRVICSIFPLPCAIHLSEKGGKPAKLTSKTTRFLLLNFFFLHAPIDSEEKKKGEKFPIVL
jgi:hypothetical protein